MAKLDIILKMTLKLAEKWGVVCHISNPWTGTDSIHRQLILLSKWGVE